MTEQFDPTRHSLFAVDVERSVRMYVAATGPEEAREVAERHEREEFELGLSCPADGYDVQKLTGAIPNCDDDMRLLGAAGWGRRELAAGRAMALLASPEPRPALIDTAELRSIEAWEWLRLATAANPWPGEDSFGAVQVEGGRGIATDRRRVHARAIAMPDGLWDAETRGAVIGPFPDCRRALSGGAASDELVDLEGAWAALREARPGPVTLPIRGRRVVLDADLLAEALLAAVGAGGPLLSLAGEGDFVRLDFPGGDRVAAIGREQARWCDSSVDLGPYVRPLQGVAAR